MAMTINTNVVSINSQRNLSLSGNSLGTTMQRLSSGLRVNSAKDDAAGLAIAERMNAQSKGLAVAARNANDGISLAQTTEGALGKVGDMLQRMRELAVQSSNATNSAADREALQAEVNQLRSEIDRVAKTTTFNGTKVLDGSFTGGVFQVGAGAGDNITVGATTKATADGLGSVKFGSTTSKDLTAADIEGLDKPLQDVTLKVGTEEFKLDTIKAASSGQERLGQLVSAINAKTADTGVTAFLAEGTKAGTYAITLKSESEKTVEVTGLESLNKAASVEVKTFAQDEVKAFTKAADVVGADFINVLDATDTDAALVARDDIVAKATELLKKLPGFDTDVAATAAAADGSAASDFAAVIEAFKALDMLDGGTDYDAAFFDTEVAKVTKAAEDALKAADTVKITDDLEKANAQVLALDENATFEQVNEAAIALNNARTAFKDDANLPQVAVTTLDDASTPAQIKAELTKLQQATDTLGLNISGVEVATEKGISEVDISTQAGAWEAIKQIDSAIDQVNAARADLGALQTRFEKSIENIDIMNENITAARGRIVDADFATETANLSRAQILQQAGTAMVAQANQLPQQVLSLLQ